MQLIETVLSLSTKRNYTFSHFYCCKKAVKVTVTKYNWKNYLLLKVTKGIIEQNKRSKNGNYEQFPLAFTSPRELWPSMALKLYFCFLIFVLYCLPEISGKSPPQTLRYFISPLFFSLHGALCYEQKRNTPSCLLLIL